MRIHNLNTETKHFRDVWEGKKKAELRKDDRGYEVGDGLMLWEIRNGERTGSRQMLLVTHVLRGVPEYGLQEGYCILSFDHVGVEHEAEEIVRALRLCSEGAPCSDCPQRPKKWNCDWKLMEKAADLIEHLSIKANNYQKALEAVDGKPDGQ